MRSSDVFQESTIITIADWYVPSCAEIMMLDVKQVLGITPRPKARYSCYLILH